MIYLAYFAGGFLVFRLIIAVGTLFMRHWLRDQPLTQSPKVSVLIPARNEEQSIGTLLKDLTKLEYEALEILVYDDSSEDRTAEIITTYVEQDSRIKILNGEELPKGWMGKNHACYQLGKAATGDYLLFLDADVRVHPKLLHKTMGHLQKHGLSLVSVFPRQLMKTFGEWITVPLMNLILVSLLPMSLIRRNPRTSLAAANGQMMLFDGAVYREHQYHEMLKSQSVEDIHISRAMKSQGYRIDTLLSDGEVECRMYDGFKGALEGFSRYTIAFFGGSIFAMLLYALFSTFGLLFVGFGLSWELAGVYLVITAMMRLAVSTASRQFWLYNLLLAPVQQVVLLVIVVESIRKRILNRNTWKGRDFSITGD